MQKTAYERRISDWSSDVCSSDLHWLAPYAIFYGYRSGGGACRAPLVSYWSALSQSNARCHPLSPAQIGRASCRERVCQYVSISVVAGTSKNKQLSREDHKNRPPK